MVETLMQMTTFERQDLREKLKEVYDLERLAGRVAFGNVNARDLITIKTFFTTSSCYSLESIESIR